MFRRVSRSFKEFESRRLNGSQHSSAYILDWSPGKEGEMGKEEYLTDVSHVLDPVFFECYVYTTKNQIL